MSSKISLASEGKQQPASSNESIASSNILSTTSLSAGSEVEIPVSPWKEIDEGRVNKNPSMATRIITV